ncbi:uncharacterized protein Z518_08923 [Rhinocladiella mackenziei CBS 650.93]|uniref:Acyltransferase MbtK/IucB-like conserved domain-containing protein n=1 Tax=Rhinocladiella mackenziei CBS 650.93 TaxID=1442369 RepID=A0A0D2GS89_9EURO|nr:uncharacterized protein Z518_08923 [Rhinocladiella mackenziei CBS 650.93]KIX01198.1 hypothetical protein Z518_08923 [Rhinocladiella mackenziei CBS 650.93]
MASLALPTTIRLPHPYLTTYAVHEVSSPQTLTSSSAKWLHIRHEPRVLSTGMSTRYDGQAPPEVLHSNAVFSEPRNDKKENELPPFSNNTAWARVRRSPESKIVWNEPSAPKIAQTWLIIYSLFTLRPELEAFRLSLVGSGRETAADELKKVGLAVQHPVPEGKSATAPEAFPEVLIVLRGNFWQGAGSPFGVRPVWAPESNVLASSSRELSSYPQYPLNYTTSTKFPEARIHSFHPRRPAKPVPGSICYSRYIPHLDEHFSMVALDYTSEEHLRLFHQWQNDPRVAAGWNETGTLDQHRAYLRNLHEDPHTFSILAKFDDTYFAYFEVFWAKEDHMGVYGDASDFDRGRHSLVGDSSFRGPHRVSAWWSSLMHYIFLDDPRTMYTVGEPKYTNTTVLSYDLMCGFGVSKLVDLPHKRSAFVRCSRERFFQICPLAYDGQRHVGGTEIPLFAKM